MNRADHDQAGARVEAAPIPHVRIFLDTEFTGFEHPELLSVGLAADTGEECYVEIVDEELHRRCNSFVQDHVLAQFGRFSGAQAPDLASLARRVGDFLARFRSPLEVCYDYRLDKELLVRALETTPSTLRVAGRLSWLNIDLETSVPEAQDAIGASLAESAYALGLHEHHALVDARALRAGFRAYENR